MEMISSTMKMIASIPSILRPREKIVSVPAIIVSHLGMIFSVPQISVSGPEARVSGPEIIVSVTETIIEIGSPVKLLIHWDAFLPDLVINTAQMVESRSSTIADETETTTWGSSFCLFVMLAPLQHGQIFAEAGAGGNVVIVRKF